MKFKIIWFYEVEPCPENNPVFLSGDIDICSYIKSIGGTCGLLMASPSTYDLSCIKDKDCIVAIGCACQESFATKLESVLKKSGASTVSIWNFKIEELTSLRTQKYQKNRCSMRHHPQPINNSSFEGEHDPAA